MTTIVTLTYATSEYKPGINHTFSQFLSKKSRLLSFDHCFFLHILKRKSSQKYYKILFEIGFWCYMHEWVNLRGIGSESSFWLHNFFEPMQTVFQSAELKCT